ncbi:hypothetical protein DLAC_01831 [Tieghemostelium lacteum]|uniref:WD40 repeat-containing protein n=1 Tax=Tieghemostelium lacteum TaxID=361077 RepID=A0A152A6G7_TIELA|nr:hypothetical protein DLAC_01831 [Tieghemostelium lacteum]|eukprot:KYR01818.1 hypothetical protein DLAC_01831 [Tieghemostelium lacteum]
MYDINCYICYNFLTEPITLFCTHSFCKDCIEKASKSDQKCPECRDEYSLPLPPINKVLHKHMLKLKGIDFVDSDDEKTPKPDNNQNNNQNNNNNNNVQIPDTTTPMVIDDPKPEFNPNLKYIAADLQHLPRDIYVNIFTPFSIRELCNLSLVCKELNKAANDNWLWKYKLIQFSQFSNPEKFEYNYKKTYQYYVQCDKNLDKGAAGTFKMTAFRGHSQHIGCLSHHGNFMSTGSNDHSIKVWDMNAKKGEALLTLNGHGDNIKSLIQLQTTVTSCSSDSTAKVWDLENGALLHNMEMPDPNVHSITYNPINSNQLVVGSDGEVSLWDLRANVRLLKFKNIQGRILKNQFNQLGNLMVNTDLGLESWDIRSPIAPLFRASRSNHFQSTSQYIFSAVGTTIQKLSISDGKLLYTLGVGNHVHGIHPHPIHPHPIVPNTPLINIAPTPPPINIHLPYPQPQPQPTNIHLPYPQPNIVPPPPLIGITSQFNFTSTNDVTAVSIGNNVLLYDNKTNRLLSTLANHTDAVNQVLLNDKKILTCSADNTIKVWNNSGSYERLYSLLGGSVAPRPTDPPVVVKGCSQIRFDQSKVIGVFNNLVRVYNFRLD